MFMGKSLEICMKLHEICMRSTHKIFSGEVT